MRNDFHIESGSLTLSQSTGPQVNFRFARPSLRRHSARDQHVARTGHPGPFPEQDLVYSFPRLDDPFDTGN